MQNKPDHATPTEAPAVSGQGHITDVILAATGNSATIPRNYYKKATIFLIFFNAISLIFSGFAFYYAIEANRIQKTQITTEMALRMGTKEVDNSLNAIRAAIRNPPVDDESYRDLERKIQPLKRQLEALGVCVSLGACDEDYVVRFACDEVLSLFDVMKLAAEESRYVGYRPNDFNGLLEVCHARSR